MNDDTMIAYGDGIKIINQVGFMVTVGGYLVRFGNENQTDISPKKDFFYKGTEFGDSKKSHTWFHHTLPVMITDNQGIKKLARINKEFEPAELSIDEVGIFAKSILDERDEYEKMISTLIKSGKIGWSSGVASHLVKRTPMKNGSNRIDRWLLGDDASYTHTPAEPRNTIVELKSLVIESHEPEANAEVTPAQRDDAQAGNGETNPNLKENTNEVNKMSDEPKAVETPQVDNTAELKKELDALKAQVTEMKSAPVTNAGAVSAPAVKKVTDRGFKDDEVKSFLHWIRTGDEVAYKAAMQGQTDSEGGYAVPDDFYNQIVAKRDQVSILRQMGVVSYPTTLDRVLVPTEGTAATKFVVTAEEGTYDENEPTLGQVVVTVHKMTKVIKISEELEMDAKANFGPWLTNIWARALGVTENYQAFNVAAAGSGAWQSATYASTLGNTAASQTVTTAAEVLALIYAMPSAYSDNLKLVMRRSVLGQLRGLASSSVFTFMPTPAGSGGPNTTSGSAGELHGIPVYLTDEMPAQAAASVKHILLFNPDFYFVAEREGMTVSRNPYLYQASGQIGLFAKWRAGGAATQAAAFLHMASLA
jgi:HK97 family phage major capsid protein